MTSEWRTYSSADFTPQQAYQFLTRMVSPRPIALVSTLSKQGAPNLAPFSFYMAGGANPPSICISVARPRSAADKDTLANIKSTGEFCISVVTRQITEQANLTSVELPHSASEWEYSGLTPRDALIVKPPLVAESPLGVECRLFQVVTHGSRVSSANYVIGEVVCFHIHQSIEHEGEINQSLVDYVGRLGGNTYVSTLGARFSYERP